MEFTGRIVKLLEKRSGISRNGNAWESQQAIFEFFEHESDRYADRVAVDTMNRDIIAQWKEGMTARIGFGHSVREYEGKYYNTLRVYKFEAIEPGAAGEQGTAAGEPQRTGQATQGAQEPQGHINDDLPF